MRLNPIEQEIKFNQDQMFPSTVLVIFRKNYLEKLFLKMIKPNIFSEIGRGWSSFLFKWCSIYDIFEIVLGISFLRWRANYIKENLNFKNRKKSKIFLIREDKKYFHDKFLNSCCVMVWRKK